MKGVAKRVKANFSDQVLAMAIALPSEATVLRMPTVDAPRTSAAKLRDQYTLNVVDGAPPSFDNGDMCIALYGQPGRVGMIWNRLYSGHYRCRFPVISFNTSGADDQFWYWLSGTVVADYGVVGLSDMWPICGATLTLGSPTHGNQLPIGKSNGVGYVFMNKNDYLITNESIGSSTLEGTVFFTVHKWSGVNGPTIAAKSIDLPLVEGKLLTNSTVYIAPVAGYYSLEVESMNITAGSNTSSIGTSFSVYTGATTGWQQHHLGDIDVTNSGDVSLAEESRSVATSILITNTSSVLSRQGTVLAARLRGVDAMDVTPTVLSKSAEKYTGEAAKGVYTFMEFSTVREQFASHVQGDKYLSYNLDIDDYYHFIHITCPGWISSPNTYTISYDTILEFKTDSSRYSKAVSQLDYNALIAARRMINANPNWFYENPQHMAALYNWITNKVGAVARGARRYAGPVSGGLAVMDPARAPLYHMLGKMLQLD
jgi:hypothetical protein